jgi:hypothetical protein
LATSADTGAESESAPEWISSSATTACTLSRSRTAGLLTGKDVEEAVGATVGTSATCFVGGRPRFFPFDSSLALPAAAALLLRDLVDDVAGFGGD